MQAFPAPAGPAPAACTPPTARASAASPVAVMDSLPEIGGQVRAVYLEKLIDDIAGFPAVRGRDLIAGLAEYWDMRASGQTARARPPASHEFPGSARPCSAGPVLSCY
jgi:hypothetical protein